MLKIIVDAPENYSAMIYSSRSTLHQPPHPRGSPPGTPCQPPSRRRRLQAVGVEPTSLRVVAAPSRRRTDLRTEQLQISRQRHARKWERGGIATEDILHPHAHWDPLAARLAPEPTEHPPTAAQEERGPSSPRAHLHVDQLCTVMVVTMSPVAAGYSRSLSWFGSVITSRNEVL